MKIDVSFFDAEPMRLVTRASQLAMLQTKIVRDALQPVASEIRSVTTKGDEILDRPLVEVGGKGLFVKELERALLSGEADAAVHSMKDMEVHFARNTEIGAVLKREDRRDALVGPYRNLDDLPKGARIGTASVRRAAILLNYRSDLQINLIRGNLNRRLGLLASGDFDAIILAVAGIKRLDVEIDYTPIDAEVMPSAVAQGALAVQIVAADSERAIAVKKIVGELTCSKALAEVTAERAFLAFLDGSCRTPISASATLDNAGNLTLDGMILRPDGTESYRRKMSASSDQAVNLGAALGAELLSIAGGHDFLA